MYTTIQTVTGQFSIERLENILMHEHRTTFAVF